MEDSDQNIECNYLVLTLKNWIPVLKNNPLFFEDPFVNFKAVKTIAIDIPRHCQMKKKKPRPSPRKINVKNSIKMILEIISSYDVELKEVFLGIPNTTASDCFAFCILALDLEDEGIVNEATFTLAENFFEKGKSLLMQSTSHNCNKRNQKMMKKAEERIKDEENNRKFRNLCANSEVTFPMKNSGLCKMLVKNNLRIIKVDVLNKNALVE